MAFSHKPRVQYQCSFCSKGQERVRRLIAGPGAVYICNECVGLCEQIIAEEHGGTADERRRGEMRALAIRVAHLIESGQDAEALGTAEQVVRELRGLHEPDR